MDRAQHQPDFRLDIQAETEPTILMTKIYYIVEIATPPINYLTIPKEVKSGKGKGGHKLHRKNCCRT